MRIVSLFFSLIVLFGCNGPIRSPRNVQLFTENWKFFQGDEPEAFEPDFDDSSWRILDLPHDWSIEGNFSQDHPGGTQGGALPTGTGWYRKTFRLPVSKVEVEGL